MNVTPAVAALLERLEARHAEVFAREGEALACLERGDVDGHRRNMEEKAALLARMDMEMGGLVDAVEDPVLRDAVGHRIRRFANSARNGLQLKSVFYMSALLYPDDHVPGQPDNLRLFIEALQEGRTEDI